MSPSRPTKRATIPGRAVTRQSKALKGPQSEAAMLARLDVMLQDMDERLAAEHARLDRILAPREPASAK
jgi:hypothetical protein